MDADGVITPVQPRIRPNPHDVWVVSGAEDGTTSIACTTVNACWNTDIDDVTLAVPTITSLTPSFGPVVGGQTVTVSGLYFGSDTTVTLGGSTIPISNLTSNSFTFVTPPATGVGMVDQVQATDAEGSSVENAASAVHVRRFIELRATQAVPSSRHASGDVYPMHGWCAGAGGRPRPSGNRVR